MGFRREVELREMGGGRKNKVVWCDFGGRSEVWPLKNLGWVGG